MDPAIGELVFTFDRPMQRDSYSVMLGPGGRAAFPTVRSASFDETGHVFTLAASLKPNWDYRFGLNTDGGSAFRSEEGVPLEPVEFSFRTRGWGPPLADTKVPRSAFSEGLRWAGPAVVERDYTIWGAAPVQDEAGRTHLFVARWPEPNVDPAWRKSSEIARYVAEHPAGPFRFAEVVLRGSGQAGDWNAYAPHNPEVQRFGDRYALFYIANSDYRQPPHPLNQSIGLVLADSPEGPWRPAGEDGLVLTASPDPEHWTHGKQVVNPAVIQIGERFHLYFKSRHAGGTAFGLAVADRLEGPYRMEEQPLTAEGVFIEDATVFAADGKVFLLTTDNHGKVTGIRGGGALWVSEDGRRFRLEDVRLGYDLIPRYYEGQMPSKMHRIYGGAPKLERPKVLVIDGRPAWLYAPSGWTFHSGERTAAYQLRLIIPEGTAVDAAVE